MQRVLAITSLVGVVFSIAAHSQNPVDSVYRPRLAPRAAGPQVADTAFTPVIRRAAFTLGKGPLVLLDEAHYNFHTIAGRYAAFARLLRRDGFRVAPLRSPFTRAALARAQILVIANALAERNKDEWVLPTPSAFRQDEIQVVRQWVYEGGSLFLIADHMPFPGAAADLAAAFGMLLTNGYATDRTGSSDEFVFRQSDGSLRDHPITRGREPSERVDSVTTFTGQAFRPVAPVNSILVLPSNTIILMPEKAWEFTEKTPRIPAEGMLQGAVVRHGRGRVALFGEAAMFSAQVSGPTRRPMGMNVPSAVQNPQFLLNIIHWLAGLLPER